MVRAQITWSDASKEATVRLALALRDLLIATAATPPTRGRGRPAAGSSDHPEQARSADQLDGHELAVTVTRPPEPHTPPRTQLGDLQAATTATPGARRDQLLW